MACVHGLEVEKSGAPRPCSVSFAQVLSLVPAVAKPVYTFLTITVAVVHVDEIAYDSPCARVYREGRCSRVVGFMIQVTDAAVAGDVRLKKQHVDKKTLRCNCQGISGVLVRLT